MEWADVDLSQHKDVSSEVHYATECKATIEKGWLFYSMYYRHVADLTPEDSKEFDNNFDDQAKAWWAKQIINKRYW